MEIIAPIHLPSAGTEQEEDGSMPGRRLTDWLTVHKTSILALPTLCLLQSCLALIHSFLHSFIHFFSLSQEERLLVLSLRSRIYTLGPLFGSGGSLSWLNGAIQSQWRWLALTECVSSMDADLILIWKYESRFFQKCLLFLFLSSVFPLHSVQVFWAPVFISV